MSRSTLPRVLVALLLVGAASQARAAGTLSAGPGADPMRILDHHVAVRIDNGFVRTEVTQVFANPNTTTTDAIYTLPLPEGAALAEMSVSTGDRSLYGEVVARDDAARIYEEASAAGGQAGVAIKQGYQRFEFHIANVAAGDTVELTFAYYQSIALDHGVGRYVYPLEEGGTDGAAPFWGGNDVVEGTFSAEITLRSALPVEDVRVPELDSIAEVTQPAPGRVEVAIAADRELDRDLVFYYRLADDLPGRVEVIPYRADPEQPGTFMMVLTPGMDLAPLEGGADYVFVLDVSGSMISKLPALKSAVVAALRSLAPEDRFRIVLFAGAADELTDGFQGASAENVARAESAVQQITIRDATNVYAGLELALSGLDPERASAILLVTDGVTNSGVVDGPSFAALLAERDVRVYGFLMGNSANWPLMQLVTETSGGFYVPISNADDIAAQIMLARSKQTHAALHDFAVRFDGGGTHDLTPFARKVHKGDQVVVFGRYDEPGPVSFVVETSITGERKRYEGSFEFPAEATENPELERLWAYAMVQGLEYRSAMELIDPNAAAAEIERLGLAYQLVTDETSMLLLDDETFARLGIDRNNRARSLEEEQARALRDASEPVNHSVAVDPAFAGTPSGSGSYGSGDYDSGWGGGAVTCADAAFGAALLLLALRARRRLRRAA